MIRETIRALAACAVTFAVCAIVYPAAVWGLGRLAFPEQAEGSLIRSADQTVIGSELISQPFASEKYFYSRPSAVDFKADATGGSNLGTKNPDLRKKVIERAEALKATESNPAPVDLVTASGGGMDPHISPDGARYQVARIAEARKMSVEQVRSLIDRHLDYSGSIIGAPGRVNVLRLNLALDAETPAATSTASPEPTPVAPVADLTAAVDAIHHRATELTARVERLGAQIDLATSDPQRGALVGLEQRINALDAESHRLNQLVAGVDGLERRINSLRDAVREIHQDIRSTRQAIEPIARQASGVLAQSLNNLK